MKVGQFYTCAAAEELNIPLYLSKVQAGFPSPAEDYMESKLDLNKYLVNRPASTFFVRATGDSMIEAGIREGDILVVDRSLEAVNNKIVIAVVEGEFTVKKYKLYDKVPYLVPENNKYPKIKLGNDAEIWGIVTAVIHKF